MPWFNLWQDRSPPACNYAFDQMALGRTAPMMRYANGFSSVCKEVSKDAISSAKAAERPPPPLCACVRQVTASKELYPEHMMGLHLNRGGVSLKILDGFHGVLARADENSSVPTITYVDPFAKASVVQLEPRVP